MSRRLALASAALLAAATGASASASSSYMDVFVELLFEFDTSSMVMAAIAGSDDLVNDEFVDLMIEATRENCSPVLFKAAPIVDDCKVEDAVLISLDSYAYTDDELDRCLHEDISQSLFPQYSAFTAAAAANQNILTFADANSTAKSTGKDLASSKSMAVGDTFKQGQMIVNTIGSKKGSTIKSDYKAPSGKNPKSFADMVEPMADTLVANPDARGVIQRTVDGECDSVAYYAVYEYLGSDDVQLTKLDFVLLISLLGQEVAIYGYDFFGATFSNTKGEVVLFIGIGAGVM